MKTTLTILFLLTLFILNATQVSTIGEVCAVTGWFCLASGIGFAYRESERRRKCLTNTMLEMCQAVEKDLGRTPVNTIPNVIFMHENMKRSIKFEKQVKTK